MIYLLYYTGLLFLYPLPADAFMVPFMAKTNIKFYTRMLSEKLRHNLLVRIIINIIIAMTSNAKHLYRHLRRRGVTVIVWVLNEEDEFEEAMLFAPEIDGMMTDCPTKLKRFVKQYSVNTV